MKITSAFCFFVSIYFYMFRRLQKHTTLCRSTAGYDMKCGLSETLNAYTLPNAINTVLLHPRLSFHLTVIVNAPL